MQYPQWSVLSRAVNVHVKALVFPVPEKFNTFNTFGTFTVVAPVAKSVLTFLNAFGQVPAAGCPLGRAMGVRTLLLADTPSLRDRGRQQRHEPDQHSERTDDQRRGQTDPAPEISTE
jgi:hypothetical protein